MSMARTVLPVLFAAGVAACGGSPTSPSPAPAAASEPGEFARFVDRQTGITTTEVRDANDQIVRFSVTGQLVWDATGARFGGFIADGVVITAGTVCPDCYILVRFATRGGERRAYLTWSGDATPERPTTILDVDVVSDRLVVAESDVILTGATRLD
jgi:hypothetical protein